MPQGKWRIVAGEINFDGEDLVVGHIGQITCIQPAVIGKHFCSRTGVAKIAAHQVVAAADDLAELRDSGVEADWTDVASFLTGLEGGGISVNQALLAAQAGAAYGDHNG